MQGAAEVQLESGVMFSAVCPIKNREELLVQKKRKTPLPVKISLDKKPRKAYKQGSVDAWQ